MGQRILFFENDARFADEVRAALAARGVEVEVTSDGNGGVDRAVETRPDLILLTIELPGVNGFLVCKKLRKLTETQAIPILILSSEATEEVFEQHRRLRTRAEDYAHKPITADALLERVGALVPLPRPAAEDAGFDSPATEMLSASQPAPQDVDREIEAFADSAFDALLAEPEEEATSVATLSPAAKAVVAGLAAPKPAAVEAAASARAEPAPNAAGEALRERAQSLEADLELATTTLAEERERTKILEARVARAEALAADAAKAASTEAPSSTDEVARLAQEVAEKAEALMRLERDAERAGAEIARLERELSEAKRSASPAPAPRAVAGSGRDILDLQAQINRKDKEALELKDMLSAKEKQLLELRDRNLELERAQADANDRQLDLERQLVEVRETAEALASDKETVSKRAEDLKSRLERAESRSKKLEEELDGERALRAADSARMTEDHARAVTDLEARHKAASDAAALDAENTKRSLETAHAEHLATQQTEHEARTAELERAHANAMADKQSAHDTLLATTRSELELARDAALEALRSSTAAELADAEARRESELARAAAERTEALAALR
ncbi:MAG: response regulator, partial [Deltaproteobacteria bacterium]